MEKASMRIMVGCFMATVFLFIVLMMPSRVDAGPSIQEVKKTVDNMFKPIQESTPHVMAREVKKKMDGGERFVLVDVRTKDEYEAAHLPGAIHIDRGLLEWVAPRRLLDTDAKIYVYCRTGGRSALATKRLMEMGYTNVTNIYDSFYGWVTEGYPVYNRHGEFTLTPQGFEKRE
jgi:rhodanese-related sulfurtransferase